MKRYFTALRQILERCQMERTSGWYRIRLLNASRVEVYTAVALYLAYGPTALNGRIPASLREQTYGDFRREFSDVFDSIVCAAFRPEVSRCTDRSRHIRRVYAVLYGRQQAEKLRQSYLTEQERWLQITGPIRYSPNLTFSRSEA